MKDGVLVIDKPPGMTSHDVVDEVRRRFKTKKVGHAGTLDPDATGILILGIGKATRFLVYSQQLPKRYRATARFGITTTTQDASGEVVETRPAAVEETDVAAAMKELVGTIEQVPPMVSAVKIGGERLYKKARRGEEVERTARRVTIFDFGLVEFVGGEDPAAVVDVTCSGGTYVRTLIHDLGERLGCGAHLTALRRTEAGGFRESDATPLPAVNEQTLRPLAESVRQLGQVEADADTARLIAHGRSLEDASEIRDDRVAFLRAGELLAVYRREGDRLVPDRVVGS